jgi:hypothetical protein
MKLNLGLEFSADGDTARELSAKLASLKGIVCVGVTVFLFGLATLFYPPLKLLIGSVTTRVAITVGGLALMVLPTLIVGNELLILGCVGAAVGLWFFGTAARPVARAGGCGEKSGNAR